MRFTNSPYEDFMKEKSYFKGVFCYREQLRSKTGGKHEP